MRRALCSLATLLAILTGLAAAPALACSACFEASNPGTRLGYYVSTAILSLTPLLIMGLMGSYVAYKYSRHARRRGQPTPAESELLTELTPLPPKRLARLESRADARGWVLYPRRGRQNFLKFWSHGMCWRKPAR